MKIRFDKPENKLADEDKGLKVSYGGSKRIMASWRWYLILLIICSPLIFFVVNFAEFLFTVKGSGYVMLPQVEIRSNESGYVKTVLVKPMQDVNSGELLCILDMPELTKKERLIDSELEYLQQNPFEERTNAMLSARDASIDFAGKQEKYMKKRLNDFVELFNQGAATGAEVKTARFQYEAAVNHLATIKNTFTENKRSLQRSGAVIASQEGDRVRQLALSKRELKLKSEGLWVYSPLQGKVLDVLIGTGEYISRGDLLMTVAKHEAGYVSAYLDPKYIKYAEVGKVAQVVFPDGESAQVKVISVPGLTKRIPLDAATAFGERNREIFIRLEFVDTVKQHLMHGMPVEVIF